MGDGKRNKQLGARGEEAAARYLQYQDYEILERNWTCPFGEADIICLDNNCLVFVEVKTRSDISKGMPEEAITAAKRAKYEKIAACYLSEHGSCEGPLRFDVIGILATGDDHAMMRHHINAFGLG